MENNETHFKLGNQQYNRTTLVIPLFNKLNLMLAFWTIHLLLLSFNSSSFCFYRPPQTFTIQDAETRTIRYVVLTIETEKDDAFEMCQFENAMIVKNVKSD